MLGMKLALDFDYFSCRKVSARDSEFNGGEIVEPKRIV
jgi:hypothetical protein